MLLIKESLLLAALGIGSVFVVLAINFLLILFIGLFQEKVQEYPDTDEQESLDESPDEDTAATDADLSVALATNSPVTVSPALSSDFDQGVTTAIMAAIYAYEEEKGRF